MLNVQERRAKLLWRKQRWCDVLPLLLRPRSPSQELQVSASPSLKSVTKQSPAEKGCDLLKMRCQSLMELDQDAITLRALSVFFSPRFFFQGSSQIPFSSLRLFLATYNLFCSLFTQQCLLSSSGVWDTASCSRETTGDKICESLCSHQTYILMGREKKINT